MGQVMAYHEWPARNSLASQEVHNPFDYMAGTIDISKVVYDWSMMKAAPRVSNEMTLAGKLGINTLLYEVGTNAGTQFSATESKTSMGNITQAFSRMGYDTSRSGLRSYNYAIISDSINHRQPVIVSAAALKKTTPITYKYTYTDTYTTYWTRTVYVQILFWRVVLRKESWTTTETDVSVSYDTRNSVNFDKERVWVIDDYEIKEYLDTIQTSSGPRVLSQKVDYVHCNFGEGGSKNGWYKSEVFDINAGPVYTEQSSVIGGAPTVLRSTTVVVTETPGTTIVDGTDGYYQYNMKIIPYLQPKYN
jgi:hypothetical protein